jgi:hypothetical protein
MKELRLHTLRGDILFCGKDGLSKERIRQLLHSQYVNGKECPITEREFSAALDEEYAKVEARRAKRKR